MATNLTQYALGEVFQTTILAWAQSDTLRLVLADPRQAAPDGIQVTLKKGSRALVKPQRFSLGAARWSELGIHSRTYPCLLCVVEGEADIRIGLIRETPRTKTARKSGVYTYSLPAQSCLIIPPDTPYDDGSTPHWERAHPETAHSQILWLQILPTGVIIHTCFTGGLSHTHETVFFIQEAQLSILMQLLLEKAALAHPNKKLVSSYLSTLLLCVQDSWNAGHAIKSANPSVSVAPSEISPRIEDAPAVALKRACHYIQAHPVDALSLTQIAHHAYVSPSQLKRIFRARLQTSVMKYVAQRRLDEAKTLLLQTNLLTEEIGVICGYPHRTHFSRAFKNYAGVSPQAFRHAALGKSLGNENEASPVALAVE